MIVNKEIKINKIDDEKRQVEVIVRVPDIPDADGDITTAEEIQEMAHTYPYWGNVDAYHNFNRVGSFVESYVLKEDRIEELPNGRSLTTPKGSWVAVLSVSDQAVWENVKEGIITGASLVAVPGQVVHEDGSTTPLKDRKWEIDDIFMTSGQTFEEKMKRIDMIFSQKADEKGKGGGTTLNAIKNLGYGLEIIDISLVKNPNQSEAQVISVKSVKEMIFNAASTLKEELMNKFNFSSRKEDEIMTKEQLIQSLKESDVIAVLKEALAEVEATEPAPVDEVKTEESTEVEAEKETDQETETETQDEIDQEKEDLKEELKQIKERLEQMTAVKSRGTNDAEITEKSTTYERKRKNGIGRPL